MLSKLCGGKFAGPRCSPSVIERKSGNLTQQGKGGRNATRPQILHYTYMHIPCSSGILPLSYASVLHRLFTPPFFTPPCSSSKLRTHNHPHQSRSSSFPTPRRTSSPVDTRGHRRHPRPPGELLVRRLPRGDAAASSPEGRLAAHTPFTRPRRRLPSGSSGARGASPRCTLASGSRCAARCR